MVKPLVYIIDYHSLVLQTLLDIDLFGCLSSTASFSSIGEALHHAMTTVKQVSEVSFMC